MLFIKGCLVLLIALLSFDIEAKIAKEMLPHIYYVNFPVVTSTGQLIVSAEFRLPRVADNEQVPAVVILHNSGGVDSTGSWYTKTLNKMGIATLELDMWSPRGVAGGPAGRPQTIQETIPDAYAALDYLAQRPEIFPDKIGVIGFSWGGVVTMLSATKQYYDLMSNSENKFAAYVAHYPLCWIYNHPFIPGFEFTELVGQPILIQVGAKDDYENDPNSCHDFAASLPLVTQELVEVKTYKRGHHAWDRLEPALRVFDITGDRGRGGLVDLIPNRRIARKSRKRVNSFFARIFEMDNN